MKQLPRILIGILISGFFIWITFRNFELFELKKALKSAQWIWFFPAGLIYFFGFILRTFRWRLLIKPFAEVTVPHLFPILSLGFLFNNILPLRAGEFARAYAGSQINKSPTSSWLGSIALERISDFFGLVYLLFLSLKVLSSSDLPVLEISLVVLAGLLICLSLVFWAKKINYQPSDGETGWKVKILKIFKNFAHGMSLIQSPKKLFLIIVLAIGIWSAEVTTALLLSHALGIKLTFFQAAALMVGISVGVMIPASPGYVGTYEFFAQQTLLLMGFTGGLVLSYILILHFFQWLISSLFGLTFFIKYKGTGLFRSAQGVS